MRRHASFLLLVGLISAPRLAAFAQDETASVVVAKVDGSIDRTVAGYLEHVVDDAEATGSTVVLQLDSAGTLDRDPVALAQRIHDATVPVVAWVGPSPAKAQGAGLLLLYAASLGAVAPGVGLGPLDPLDLAAADELSPDEVRSLATSGLRERGRATPAIFPEEPVPAQAAIDGNVAEFAAVSVPDLLDQIDGTSVRTADGEATLRTKIARVEGQLPVNVRFVDLGPVDRVLHAASSPTWVYVLLVLGLAALAFELTQAGVGFAGVSGIVMVALAVYGLTVVPFSWMGLGLLLLGIALMTLDVRIRRLGPLTAFGLASFAGGSLLVFGAVAEQIDVSPWLIGSFGMAAFLYWGFVLTVAVASRERITSRQRGLVGLVGEARGELKPEGPVYVKGTLWRGRSVNGPIEAGTRVRVRAVDGLILRVQPEPGPVPDPGPGPNPAPAPDSEPSAGPGLPPESRPEPPPEADQGPSGA
jgi:membrane-bound serine protease (ClpP class)